MVKHISGKKGPHLMLYSLSTCPWCQKTKELLGELGLEYYYADADLLIDSERLDVMSDVERWNPKRSFPTIVVDNSRCIIGCQENELRGLLRV
ncbi:MAG: glutaredoxin family protein [Dehalococcoidia bacterium]|nr:glutaredoxin family protein [Dehalococcoidia bacterium]